MEPGCYIFRDKHGQPIYVGKSKALRKRIKQHFSQGAGAKRRFEKHSRMITESAGVECIVTGNETEALILEYRLIREYLPRYNSQYIRKQVFQYVVIDTALDYPTISVSDKPPPDGGTQASVCFRSPGGAAWAIELLGGVWGTPVCGLARFPPSAKPCMNYHIEKCIAPCAGMPTAEDYRRRISEIITCLSGDCAATLEPLKKRMRQHSDALEFELASQVKAQIDGITALSLKQRRIEPRLEDKQVCLFVSAYNEPQYSLYFIRHGQVLAHERFADRRYPFDAQIAAFAKRLTSLPDIPDAHGFPPAQALIHIAADKFFAEIPPGADQQRITEVLTRGRGGFLGTCSQ